MTQELQCWCGNADLLPFSEEYRRCPVCETLVLAQRPEKPIGQVNDDEQDFYGRHYWFEHQQDDLGQAPLLTRVRQDLPERCVYWLRTLLAYKTPPGRSLELGCAHGGFVALLNWAGFSASGLELSPWVADFARRTFDIPVYVGPVESQDIEPGSLDVVIALDVVEHLEVPPATIAHCLKLLRSDGMLLIQTPCYPAGKSYEELVADQSPFLAQLKAPEHIHLFSEKSIRELFTRAGFEHVRFEPAIFAHYDMFVVASPQPLTRVDTAAAEERLTSSSSGRLVQALLDIHGDRGAVQHDLAEEAAHVDWLKQQLAEVERDRAARLAVLQEQGARLGQIGTLQADIDHLKAQVMVAEADRAARLTVIERQGEELGRLGALEADITFLKQQIGGIEEDRQARLAIIERQAQDLARIPQLEARLAELTEQYNTRVSSLLETLRKDEGQAAVVRQELVRWQLRSADLEREVSFVSRSRILRLLRRIGFFRRLR